MSTKHTFLAFCCIAWITYLGVACTSEEFKASGGAGGGGDPKKGTPAATEKSPIPTGGPKGSAEQPVPNAQPDSKDGSVTGTSDTGDTTGDIATDQTTIADTCEKPSGSPSSNVSMGGEDVFGNGLVGGPDSRSPGGSDFDDFSLILSGNVVIDQKQIANKRIGILKPTSLSVSYARGTSDCTHSFSFIVRKCPNNGSTVISQTPMSAGAGDSASATINVTEGDVYLDILMTVTGSSSRRFAGCPPGIYFPAARYLYNSQQGDINIIGKPALTF